MLLTRIFWENVPSIFIFYSEVKDIKLNSEVRAKHREDLAHKRETQQIEHERLMLMQEEENKRKEEAEIKALRKKMEFKANDVRKFTGVLVRPSDKQLTEAYSPKFSDRFKK